MNSTCTFNEQELCHIATVNPNTEEGILASALLKLHYCFIQEVCLKPDTFVQDIQLLENEQGELYISYTAADGTPVAGTPVAVGGDARTYVQADEVPDGIIDTFSSTQLSTIEMVFINGQLVPASAVNPSGSTIILAPSFIPQPGDRIELYGVTA